MAIFGSTTQQSTPSHIRSGNLLGGTKKKPLSYKQAYPAAVEQTGEDYGNIMKGYQGILDKGPNPGLTSRYEQILNQPSAASKFSPITAATQSYSRDPNVTKSLGTLDELSQTGGYSADDIANIRARGISPIRSVYANAMQNMNRQKSLSGGYSPNANAATARMTRELSDQIAGATQNVNADIAQKVAAGRQSMAPQFAQFSAREADAQRGIEGSNVAAQNRAAEFNASGQADASRFGADERMQALGGLERLQGSGDKLSALEGMKSLYGTTPALANTFGNQAAQAAQIQQQATGQSRAAGGVLASNYPGANRAKKRDPWGRW